MFFWMVAAVLPAAANGAGEERRACLRLRQIELDDDELLAGRQREELLAPYLGRCLDPVLVKELLDRVTGWYMDHGYVTTRPYLREQQVGDGRFEISVMKGVIERVVDAETKAPTARTRTAFAFQEGRVLNLRDLETALEAMNRPPSSSAWFDIVPGTRPGASIVEVGRRDGRPVRFRVGVSGSESLGDDNPYLTAELALDNPLSINDILRISYNGSRVQEEYQGTRGSEIDYSFPVAAHLVALTWSDFSYRQGVDGLDRTYLSNGRTRGLRVRLGTVVARDQRNKLEAGISIQRRRSENYFEGQPIDVSSYVTTQLRLDLTHTHLRPWGSIVTRYDYHRGTDWFGARRDDYYDPPAGGEVRATLQFRKHTLSVRLTRYFDMYRRFHLESSAFVQYSGDLLYDNDKLTVGSDYTVRGYTSPSLYGNNAWYLHNDLVATWPVPLQAALLQSVSTFVGLDYGRVRCEVDNRGGCGKVYGAAAGVRTAGGRLTGSFVWSRPLKEIGEAFERDSRFRFDLTWRF